MNEENEERRAVRRIGTTNMSGERSESERVVSQEWRLFVDVSQENIFCLLLTVELK